MYGWVLNHVQQKGQAISMPHLDPCAYDLTYSEPPVWCFSKPLLHNNVIRHVVCQQPGSLFVPSWLSLRHDIAQSRQRLLYRVRPPHFSGSLVLSRSVRFSEISTRVLCPNITFGAQQTKDLSSKRSLKTLSCLYPVSQCLE